MRHGESLNANSYETDRSNEQSENTRDFPRIIHIASRALRKLINSTEENDSTNYDTTTPNSAESLSENDAVRVGNIIKQVLDTEVETDAERLPRPRGEIICDHDQIEDQRIDIIDNREDGIVKFRFKLRDGASSLAESLKQLSDKEGRIINEANIPRTPGGLKVKFDGGITFKNPGQDKNEPPLEICSAFTFARDGITVRVADHTRGHNYYGQEYYQSNELSAVGLVEIDAPRDMPPNEIASKVGNILSWDLGVKDALAEVSGESLSQYKRARYAWVRKENPDNLSAEDIAAAMAMELEEVSPGYSTYVQKNRHQELLAISGEKNARVIHTISSRATSRDIATILKEGLLCTTERLYRGTEALRIGASAIDDIQGGGADSVFTHLADVDNLTNKTSNTIVFKPSILDRTDYYAQETDTYGRTDKITFNKRVNPEVLFTKLKEGALSPTNELMFRTGIGSKDIDYILVTDEGIRTSTLEYLRQQNIHEIHGKPIDELIKTMANPE